MTDMEIAAENTRTPSELPGSENPKTEKSKTEKSKTDTPSQKPKKPKSAKKRGPARPYRKLEQEKLLSRITKLQRRLERAKQQAEETGNFLQRYTKEQEYRESDLVTQV